MSRYAVLDNGAYRLKYGYSTDNIDDIPPRSMPNCTAKILKSMQSFTGDEIDLIQNTSQLSLSRPFDRGYLTNWNIEKEILNRVFDSNHLDLDPMGTNLVFTTPPFCPDEIQTDTNEVLFEEFRFSSVLCRPSPWFSAYEYAMTYPTNSFAKNCIVIDSGFSFSHVLPFFEGNMAKAAVKRVNIGGKLLTNFLKETISFRQWNVMDEFLLMNQVKEAVCFVSTSFDSDLANSFKSKGEMIVSKQYTRRDPILCSIENCDPNSQQQSVTPQPNSTDDSKKDEEDEEEDIEYLRKFFVMPDFHRIMKGYVKEEGEAFAPDEQVLTMESERFTVPEVLFRPTDLGMNQAGITEAVGQSLNCLHELEVGLCVKNIILTGGNACLPNYKTRIHSEILQYIPHQWVDEVQVYLPSDPVNYSWRGASRFVQNELRAGTINKHFVTKQEYNEYGSNICSQKWNH